MNMLAKLIVAGALPAFATAASAQTLPVEKLAQAETVKLSFASQTVVSLPLMVALEKGYFEKAGINVEFRDVKGSLVAELPMLARGDVDVSAQSAVPALYNQFEQGFGVRLVASLGTARPDRLQTLWLTVLKEKASAVKNYVDLRGLSVEAGVPGSPLDIIVLEALRAGNLRESDVKIERRLRSNSDFIPLINSKTSDVFATNEPQASILEKQGVVVKWKSYDEVVPWYPRTSLAMSEAFLTKRADVATKFLEVYLAACDELNRLEGNWTDEVAGIAAKYLAVPIDEVKSAGKIPYYDPAGKLDPAAFDQAQKLWVSRNLVKQAVDINQMLETKLAAAAAAKLGK